MAGVGGVSLGFWQDREPLEALDTAVLADEAGYPELWIGEMATFDAFALAAAAGLRTSSVRIVVGPLAAGVCDPMALAMGVASVAALVGRSVDLAIGASSPVLVAGWDGRAYERPARLLDETAAAVRPLLRGEKVSFTGALVRSQGYRLRLPPPGASLTVAAFGPASVRVAATRGDRMVVNLCTPEVAGRLRATLDAEAAAAGAPSPRLAAWVPAAVDPTPEAVAQLRRGLVAYVAAPGYAEMFERAGFDDVVAAARAAGHPGEVLASIPDRLVEAIGIVGDAATCRRRVAAFSTGGVDEVVIVPATAGDPSGRRTLDALAPGR